MDFDLTQEQRDIQKAAREFAEKEFDKDYSLEVERSRTFPWEVWKKACELGFVGIDIPEIYGGQGFDLLERVIVTEEFCRSGAGVGLHASHPGLGIEIILWSGSEDRRRNIAIEKVNLNQRLFSIGFSGLRLSENFIVQFYDS